jgi:hypothetical protein
MIWSSLALPAALRWTNRRNPSASAVKPSSASDRRANTESRTQLAR